MAGLALTLAGVAPAAEPAGCSLADGAPWQEFQSRHFLIDVAGWTGDPARLVGAFEELHATVLAALVAEPVEIPGRVRVVVLPRHQDLYDYTGSTAVQGLFWITRLGEPAILVTADQIDDLPQVVAHELTHHISKYLFPSQAYWFAEGLAQFFEGVAKVDGEGRRWAGSAPSGGAAAGSIKLPRMAELVGYGSGGLYTQPYLASWILYRFLWNERGKQLARYQQQLMDGAEPPAAWAVAFPEWDLPSHRIDRLDNDIARHQVAGRGLRWEVKAGEVDRSFSAQRPSLGDLHLALLGLRLAVANPLSHQGLRREALQEATREDPANALVAVALARDRGEPSQPVLRALLERQPDDGRGWYLLGLAEEDPGEREAALRRAVARWPGGALANAELAAHLARTGRARAGLPFANRAMELAPWSPRATAALAAVALGLSKCQEALTLQARAVATVEAHRPGSSDADAEALRSALASMRQRCQPAAPAP